MAEDAAGDLLIAIRTYSQAIGYFKQKLKKEPLQHKIATLLDRLADLHSILGHFDEAIQNYKDAIDLYLSGDAPLTETQKALRNCHLRIGVCLLANLDFKTALSHFMKAIEYGEKSSEIEEYAESYSSLDTIAEFIMLNLALSILCLIKQAKDVFEIMPLLIKAIELNEVHGLSGFASDLCAFFSSIINNDLKEAYKNFKTKLLLSQYPDFLNSTLHSVVLGLLTEFAENHIPATRLPSYKTPDDTGKVIFSRESFEEMLIYGLAYANMGIPASTFREVIALVVGKIEKNDVIITEIVPITSGTETEVEFKDEHYARAAEINDLAADRNEFIVGWYHTHPGLGLFLSPADIINQLGYQSLNEKAIALVYDFTKTTPSRSGLMVFRLDTATLTSGSYHLVPWQIKNSSDISYAEMISIFPNFLATLHQALRGSSQMSLAQLAEALPRSLAFLEEVIPKISELKLLPNIDYAPETKILFRNR